MRYTTISILFFGFAISIKRIFPEENINQPADVILLVFGLTLILVGISKHFFHRDLSVPVHRWVSLESVTAVSQILSVRVGHLWGRSAH